MEGALSKLLSLKYVGAGSCCCYDIVLFYTMTHTNEEH